MDDRTLIQHLRHVIAEQKDVIQLLEQALRFHIDEPVAENALARLEQIRAKRR